MCLRCSPSLLGVSSLSEGSLRHAVISVHDEPRHIKPLRSGRHNSTRYLKHDLQMVKQGRTQFVSDPCRGVVVVPHHAARCGPPSQLWRRPATGFWTSLFAWPAPWSCKSGKLHKLLHSKDALLPSRACQRSLAIRVQAVLWMFMHALRVMHPVPVMHAVRVV